MRKFEDLTLSEQKDISGYLWNYFRVETTEQHKRKLKLIHTNNCLEICADVELFDYIYDLNITEYHCLSCDQIVLRKDLVEHVMIHLGLE